MKKYLVVICICLSLLISGCNNNERVEDNSKVIVTSTEAKEKLKAGALLVDVRTRFEYDEGHIEGAILYPLDEINNDTVSTIFPDKETAIIVYCQSGNRSSQALEKLKSLGYTNVYDLGSINNWED